jgi:hypothetical protein
MAFNPLKGFSNPWDVSINNINALKTDALGVQNLLNNNLEDDNQVAEYNYKAIKVTDYEYSKLEDNYESDGQKLLNKYECLSNLRNKGTNTCAIKLSYTLNKSGYYIPHPSTFGDDVRIARDKINKNNNFILDAASMVNYLRKIESPMYFYKRTDLDTDEKIDKAIEEIHTSDDLRGIVGLVADDWNAYGATGHVDLIYEDAGWDFSLYGMRGKDLIDYLKEHLIQSQPVKFDLFLWVLEKD